jgi:hypothetical protein
MITGSCVLTWVISMKSFFYVLGLQNGIIRIAQASIAAYNEQIPDPLQLRI